jgi:hypothetical protein
MKTIQFKIGEMDYDTLLGETRENTGSKAITKAIEDSRKYKELYEIMRQERINIENKYIELKNTVQMKLEGDEALKQLLI